MDTINLFPTKIIKTTIDPQSYDKDKLCEEIVENYKIDNHRRASPEIIGDFPDSTFHTYFNDWDNNRFNKVETNQLLQVYQTKILEFLKEFQFKEIKDFRWTLDTINVGTNGTLTEHDHFVEYDDGFYPWYSTVHYMKLKPHHPRTTFINPLIYGQYDHPTKTRELLNDKDVSNSTYFRAWHVDTFEDDMIFFPSYLRHSVRRSPVETDDLRIVTSINILLKVK